jgi:hypothetical protein
MSVKPKATETSVTIITEAAEAAAAVVKVWW